MENSHEIDSIKLNFGSDSRTLEPAPMSFEELQQEVKRLFKVKCEAYQYLDEEGDLITISSNYEYTEARRQIHDLAIIVPLQNTTPLDQIEEDKSDGSIILLSPDEDTSPQVKHPEKDEKAYPDNEDPFKEYSDKAVSADTPCVSEQGTDTVGGTKEQSNETQEILKLHAASGVHMQDSASDGLSSTNRQCATVSIEVASIGFNTVQVPMNHQSFNTQVSVNIGVGPNKVDAAQQEELHPENYLKSIQNVLRQELAQSLLSSSFQRSGLSTVHNLQCFLCATTPIIGIAYKCSICTMNLCEVCEDTANHPHPMFKCKKAAFSSRIRPSSKELFTMLQKLRDAGYSDQQRNLQVLQQANYDLDQALLTLRNG